jgi:diaminopimelate decarboxylase
MSLFELQLAIKLGYKGREIVVNGPYKTAEFLENCVAARTYLIIVDSLFELENLSHICDRLNTRADILLRINPDYVPSGMNQGSSTASRKGSPLGLDPKSGEIGKALQNLREYRYVNFRGIHFHIGTGIQDPSDYAGALKKLSGVVKTIRQSKFQIQIIDTGGGFGISSSREMTSFELIRYQATGQLPPWKHKGKNLEPEEFFKQITAGITKLFPMGSTPELIVEPGRIITGASQCLLLRVHQVKKRDGLPDWVITNGGVGTVTMPTYYEYHRVSLCNEFNRKTTKKVTLTGPGCFAADVVYRNIRMPELKPGEIIAIMDTGAYFTSWESNFSHPLPAIVAVNNGNHRLIRRRQDFEDMIARDVFEPESLAGD